MTRFLYLIRHAQSADKQIGQTDKQRVLTTSGFAEAEAVGKFLKEKVITPDLIITSSATRAQTTATVISEEVAYAANKIIIQDDLYEADVNTFLNVISTIENDKHRVMIVGHNPIISLITSHLLHTNLSSLQPAELVVLKFEAANWNDTPKEKARLAERFHPDV